MSDLSVNPQVQRLRDHLLEWSESGIVGLNHWERIWEDVDVLADALEIAEARAKAAELMSATAGSLTVKAEAERDEARQALQRIIDSFPSPRNDAVRQILVIARAGVSADSEGAPRDEHTTGAIEMARHWLRNPGQMVDAGFEQVCRELYTVSRALVKVAGSEGAQP